MLLIDLASCFLATLLVGLALTPAVRWLAMRQGLTALPRGDRWHRSPTAILGGLAIYGAFVAGFLAFAPANPRAYPIIAAGTLLLVIGLVDDIVHLKPYAKLVAQLIAAAGIVSFGLRLPWTSYEVINDVITIFWLVGITNAINLLDNMDGLAAGVSLISCVFLTVTFILNGQTAEAFIPALLGGAILGFLVFNFNPASIFMGDCGAMFLGVMVSGTALLSNNGRFRSVTSVLLTPALIMMLPIFDTCLVTVTRKLSGRRISQGGRDHVSHRLVALGMSERGAVLMLYSFASVSGVLALMVILLETPVVLALVPGFALLVLLLGLYLGKVVIYREGEKTPGLRIVSAIADFSYKRRVFEVLMDVILVVLAYYAAYLLRWDGNLSEEQLGIFLKTAPILIIIEILFLLIGGVYRGLWRYIGADDLLVIARSVFAGTAASALTVFIMYNFSGPSRAVFLLNMILLLLFISGSRFSFRILGLLIEGRKAAAPNGTPVLIYGAEDDGELLIQEILRNPEHCYAPVGFIEDDLRKVGKLIHGYRIFAVNELPDLVRTHGIKEVLVSSLKVPNGNLDVLRSMGVCLKKTSIRFE